MGSRLGNRVRAGVAPLAFDAGISEVEGIDPLHHRVEVGGFVGEEAGFEVSAMGGFGPESGSSEIGGADEGFFAIDDEGFGVDAGAENAFEEIGLDEGGVAVEVFSESGAWLLSMKKSHCDPVLNEIGKDFEKGDKFASFCNVQILDVCGDDPEKTTCLRS